MIALDPDTLQLILSYNGIPSQKHTVSYAITRFAKAANNSWT